jgi:hypothetical protein
MAPRTRLPALQTTACAILFAGALTPGPALAQDALIVVRTTGGGVDADGACSLVEAIENANAAGAVHADCAAGADATTIELAPGESYTLSSAHNAVDGGTGLPVVTRRLTIVGRGAVIERDSSSAAAPFRLLVVASGARLILLDVTLRGGLANAAGAGLGGGAILTLGTTTLEASTITGNAAGTDGGGISNLLGTLTIRNSSIAANSAVNSGGGLRNAGGTVVIENSSITGNRSTGTGNTSRGGGVANHATPADATMTVTGGTIAGNQSAGIGGGGLDNAAAPNRTARVSLTGVSVLENVAAGVDHTTGLGGGIQNSFFRGVTTGAVRLELHDTIVRGNRAINGGGVSSAFDLSGAREVDVRVVSSEIADNVAAGDGFQVGNGGGLYVVNGTALVANTTISGNKALGTGSGISGLGGGLANMGLSSGGASELALVNATVADNQARQGGALFTAPFDGSATVTLANTLFARNVAGVGAACATPAGTILSHGHNLEDGDSCSLAQPTDLPNVAAGIGGLASNGGAVRTHALLPGSPAIDAASLVACSQPPVDGVDARGVTRPQGAACDIGAYEGDWAPVALTLATAFDFNGQQRLGTLWLMADGRSVDQNARIGAWYLPAAGVVAVAIDGQPRTFWLGWFTTPTRLVGFIYALDGSAPRGTWRGDIVAPG